MTADQLGQTVGVLEAVAAQLERGDMLAALLAAEAAVADPQQHLDAMGALAALAFRQGHIANTLRILSHIVDAPGASADVAEALAVTSCLGGNVTEALYYGKLATALPRDGRLLALFGPDLPEFARAFLTIEDRPLLRKAVAAFDGRRLDDALSLLEQHLQLFPGDVEALDRFGNVLALLGRNREAVAILRSVLTVGGGSATLFSRLGRCLTDLGEFDQAMACHRAALVRAPKAIGLWAACVLGWEYSPWKHSASRQQAVDGLLALMAATPVKPPRKPRRLAERDVLTIGLLCGSTVEDETRLVISQLASAFDRSRVEVVGFGHGGLEDAHNLGWRGGFDRWRDTSKVDELTLSALIRGEAVDVLIDIEGLAATESRTLFQRQCAPLQYNWLNVPQDIRLPGAHGNLAWEGPASCGPMPLRACQPQGKAAPSEGVTFGADVTLGELNAEVVRAWSTILHAVPNSSLVLFDRGLSADDEAIDAVIAHFGNFGAAHLVDVVGSDGSEFFAGADIALAPFPVARPLPYGRALSLGLPVVALGGVLGQVIGALGDDALGMAATDVEDYVAKATAWAEDCERLAQRRATMPARLGDAVIYSPAAFAKEWERFFRDRLAALQEN